LNNSSFNIGNTEIVDTFAEGFSMRYTRLIVTAMTKRWLQSAMNEFCGYGSSVIGCDAEIAVESWVPETETPDGRCGASVLAFGFSADALGKAIGNRTGQCLMTCPTTAVFSGLAISEPSADSTNLVTDSGEKKKPERIELGSYLRYFGDGYQKSKLLGERRFWRIPVMDGEFLIEESVGVAKGVAGGNFLIQSDTQMAGLLAAERAVDAIQQMAGVITPFPGGVVRSGSKVGSRYPSMKASTSHGFCPTLRGRVESSLAAGVNCVYEIVIDGVDFETVSTATKIGIKAAIGDGVIAISAGNYGGKLGKHHFHLHQVLEVAAGLD
jgi:formylmethanofuran--tetrahydromethanopterin N-formyltransferase